MRFFTLGPRALALGVSLLVLPLPETSLAAKAAATHDPRSPKATVFPPHPLDKHRQEWLKAFSEATADVPKKSPERVAWILGAWWAMIDWCADQGNRCEKDAAQYAKKVLGTDPRAVNDCGWEGAIGGDIGDGYDVTSETLYGEKRKPAMLPDLFEKHQVKRCPK